MVNVCLDDLVNASCVQTALYDDGQCAAHHDQSLDDIC